MLALLFGLVTLAITSCGVTIVQKHDSIQDMQDPTPAALVYFIRPTLIKPKGYSDKPVTVEYHGKKLLEIPQGNYLLMKIKPGKGNIITHSMTKFTNQLDPIKVSRQRAYNFIAGKTYFIHIKQLNEEFRGVFYDPRPIDLDKAKEISLDARAYGNARSALIENIESVPETPPTGKIIPAYPEQLYKQSPYLLKKPVQQ